MTLPDQQHHIFNEHFQQSFNTQTNIVGRGGVIQIKGTKQRTVDFKKFHKSQKSTLCKQPPLVVFISKKLFLYHKKNIFKVKLFLMTLSFSKKIQKKSYINVQQVQIKSHVLSLVSDCSFGIPCLRLLLERTENRLYINSVWLKLYNRWELKPWC